MVGQKMDRKGTGLPRRISDVAGMDAAARGAQETVRVDGSGILAGRMPDPRAQGQFVRMGEGFHIKSFYRRRSRRVEALTGCLAEEVHRQNRHTRGAGDQWLGDGGG